MTTMTRSVAALLRSRACPLLCTSSIRNLNVPTARRLVSELAVPSGGGGPTGGNTSTSTPSFLVLLVSRRAFLKVQQQQQLVSPAAVTARLHSNQKADETPWPRNVVYAFYAACSILIPFSVAWFLASNEAWRTRLLGSGDHDDEETSNVLQRTVLQSMRNWFGEVDERALSEPERVALLLLPPSSAGSTQQQQLPHKFVDEPTAAVRRRQAQIEQQQQQQQQRAPENVTVVRLFFPSSDDETPIEVTLPAATRANPEAVRRALQQHAPHIQLPQQATLALDFPESEPERETENETAAAAGFESSTPAITPTTTTTTASSNMSIYSLWHYHSTPFSTTTAAGNGMTMSDLEIQLSRLNHEIAALQQELSSSSSSRAIDDIQTELRQKQTERRRLRRKQWLGV